MFELVKSAVNALTRKESRSWNAILSLGITGPQWMAGNYASFAREGYVWNSTVYACVNKTYGALRGVKFGAYRQKGAGQALVPKGPLAELIRRPNPRQSFGALVGEWAGSMEITGNAYFEGLSNVNRNSDLVTGPPRELYILRPDRMFVVPGTPDVPILGYEYRAGSVVVSYPTQLWRSPVTGGLVPRSQILHSKYWNPTIEDGDWYGLSPIKAAARNIDAFNSAVAWNVGLTQNTARPSGIFTSPDNTITTAQAEEYTNLIRQKFSGAANAGRPMVLGKGLTWEQIGLSPVDMDWLAGLSWNSRQICAIFGIPPQLIADEEAKTYANYGEARRSVWMEKWLNMLDMLCDDLNSWLAPMYWDAYGEEVTVGYDKDSIEAIQEDRQLKWKNAKDGTGFLRINEQRALLGYDPLTPDEGGDDVLVPVGMVPLRVSSSQTDMPAVAAAAAAPTPDDTSGNPKPSSVAASQKPKPGKKLPPGKKPDAAKPAGKPKPAKKGLVPDDILDADFDEVPDPADLLLHRIAEQRESLKLLSGE